MLLYLLVPVSFWLWGADMSLIKSWKDRILRGSETFAEPEFFYNPLSSSRFFRNNTIEMLLAIGVGIFVLIQWWAFLSGIVKFVLALALLVTVSTWLRTALDHRKLHASLLSGSGETATTEALKLASQEAHAGPYSTITVALFLFLALAMLLGHYDKPSWMRQFRQNVSDSRPVAQP